MLAKLSAINDRYNQVEELISSPDAMNDMKVFIQLSKEYKDLEPIIKAYKEYKDLVENIAEAKELISTTDDVEMKEMAKIDLVISTFVIYLSRSNLTPQPYQPSYTYKV